MRRRMLFLVSGLLVGAALTQAPALAAQDLDCVDFPNQEAAQKEFDRYDTDVHGLDRDGDRIACEWVNVGGGVRIEDSVDAGGTATRARIGATYGSPSGARAEPRSGSGDAWKAETVDSSGETVDDGGNPDEVISDGDGYVAGEEQAEELPHTGAQTSNLLLLGMSLLVGGAVLLRGTAYRPSRLVSGR
jgi:LPXTG-motif cell wall-anchored protein